MRTVRVLVVDDSLTMRRLIRLALSADSRIEVVGEARDAAQAKQRLAELKPDVMTLDVEMPGVSGLDLLAELMTTQPIPVVMVSTETHRGSAAAIEALSLGAVECVGKPTDATRAEAFSALPDVVVMASQAKVTKRSPEALQVRAPSSASFIWNGRYVLIGSSTGGVEALEKILQSFPKNCPPTVIVQHMPESFLANFAQRLNGRISPTVQLASTGAPLLPGNIYLAPGGETHLTLAGQRGSPVCQLIEGEKRSGHRPSIDNLFDSAVFLGDYAVAVILTGMGRDGADGMLRMRKTGSNTLAQDKDSSVVWGMPRAAYENGATQNLVPLHYMSDAILQACGRQTKTPAR
ncbi:protein-glutamate methylesterase/protein-glutamine glutaminase [Paracoccus aminophilus]|uniref:Protein-glutamate methylesterase/protein-glutamine glutaminase n=1 Tax=Paracoccus aminophilus JCM 7686 TaxID=1367847 RepID=S5YBB1_PARAH|nr:chemotaxis response regulator protein-glutamate methylesterase [Paracoccus aminophilus]AGT08738.1 two-component system, chemotaxis family, response regulator CheB [Paracoccus aminophilus JCM 7686]